METALNAEGNRFEPPRWLRDLVRFLPLKSQFVLSGNVRDLQVVEYSPNQVAPVSLLESLRNALSKEGFGSVIAYEPLKGFSVLHSPEGNTETANRLLTELGLTPSDGVAPAGIDLLGVTIERITNWSNAPLALVIDFASMLITRQSDLPSQEHQLFTRAFIQSHRARAKPFGQTPKPFFNNIIWVIEREGDIPDWLMVNNPRIRHISVSKPSNLERRAVASPLLGPLASAKCADDALPTAVQAFTHETEGMLLLDMASIATLARVEGLELTQISDAVRRYKIGVTEDPWLKLDREKIAAGADFIGRRVKGQRPAITHMLDIIKKAMTGIGSSRRGNRPRGVAFLAGPTGVGKTELAKTVTSLLFGDESAYIRFDMSEFSAEHSDQRLLGAPPGYVGYDAGGELTNAIREKPFCVILFDEIEKAHPRVLDKFLQILDDGVLTSGRGERVYFSEALIVFTSNLGIYKTDEHGQRSLNVSPSEPYKEVQLKVHNEIEKHFRFVLNRPEILNRIGENVIVFDYIRPEIAKEIFSQMIKSSVEELRSQEIAISFSEAALESLKGLCLSDLTNGGRGIRNQLEAHFLNPLARELFDRGARAGERYRIDAINAEGLDISEA